MPCGVCSDIGSIVLLGWGVRKGLDYFEGRVGGVKKTKAKIGDENNVVSKLLIKSNFCLFLI